MGSLSFGFRPAFAAFLVAFSSAGCSTVIRADGAEELQASASERQALRDAATVVAKTPWPKPSSSTLAERLTGVEPDRDKVSRDDAIDVYVDALSKREEAEKALMADADRHLEAARALNAVAEAACDAPNPRLADVALLEDAISDLRETRSIYVASLKKLDGDDLNIELLKQSFDDVIKSLGVVADDLAKNAMNKNAEAFAGPDAVAGAL